MKEAKEFLLNSSLFKENDYVVVAVSGGPDSMALFHMLISLRNKLKINLVCAHVNHNVRKESDEEKVFVENYCKDNNVIFEYMKIDKYKNNTFSEKEARLKRYAFFNDLIKKYDSNVLLTAHHGDDLIETVLMRLVRGSTLKGYAGFSIITDMEEYKAVKPLIFYTKAEIEKYIEKNKIPFVIDKSNFKDEYTRNRYRHKVLPFLKAEEPKVNTKFLKFSELLLEYNDYVDKEMLKYLKITYKSNKLNIKKYLELDNLIKRRMLNYILELIYDNDLSLMNDSHIELINKLINSNKPNGSVKLPNNVKAIKDYNDIYFEMECNDSVSLLKKELQIDVDTKWNNDSKFKVLKESNEDSNYICRLDSKDITLPLYIRTKLDGDKMSVKGLLGSKKIKDIFINSKISIKDRNNWPIVVDEKDNIVWLPGLKKSKYNKEKNEKCDIIFKYIIKEEK